MNVEEITSDHTPLCRAFRVSTSNLDATCSEIFAAPGIPKMGTQDHPRSPHLYVVRKRARRLAGLLWLVTVAYSIDPPVCGIHDELGRPPHGYPEPEPPFGRERV